MSIEPHIMDDESVLDHCVTDYWTWIVTDRRVVKHKNGKGNVEQLHDLSFEEITSISVVRTGKNTTLVIAGILSLLFGLISIVQDSAVFIMIGIAILVLGAYLLYLWYNSETSYFEFNGSGLLQNRNHNWRINQKAAKNPEEVRSFVKEVRNQL